MSSQKLRNEPTSFGNLVSKVEEEYNNLEKGNRAGIPLSMEKDVDTTVASFHSVLDKIAFESNNQTTYLKILRTHPQLLS